MPTNRGVYLLDKVGRMTNANRHQNRIVCVKAEWLKPALERIPDGSQYSTVLWLRRLDRPDCHRLVISVH